VNGTVSKVVLGAGVDSMRLTELRSAGAFAGLLLLALVLRPASLRVTRRELPWLAAYGVAGFAMVQWLYFVAIGRLPVGIGLLFEFTAPLLVALFARFVLRQQVGRRVWVALALCLGGLACVAEVGGKTRLDGLGVVAGLLCAVALATYFLLGERAVSRRDPVSLTCWAFFFSAAFWSLLQPWWTFPVAALGRSAELTGVLDGVTVPVWALAAWIVVLGSIAPFLLNVLGLKHLPATTVGIVGMAEPVLASAVAWGWLGERLRPLQLLGGVVVLAGIALAQTARRTATLAAPAEAPVAAPATTGASPRRRVTGSSGPASEPFRAP